MDQNTVNDITRELSRARDAGHTGALIYSLPQRTCRGVTYAPRALAPGDVLLELFVCGRPTGAAEVRAVLAFEATQSGHPVAIPLAAYAQVEEVEVAC